MSEQTLFLNNESATQALGASLARVVQAPCVIFLEGELGAGKTTLMRGLLQALGFSDSVKSPTYSLMESYAFHDITVHHFDLYRVKNPLELDAIGAAEYFNEQAICCVEWPEFGVGWLPDCDVCVVLSHHDNAREAKFIANSKIGEKVLGEL